MNPSAALQAVAQPFREDLTVRWSCRRGEYVLWVGTDSLLKADQASSWTIRDFWEMRDGEHITITNRWVDLPGWFEPHPSEVANSAALEMMKRLDAGDEPKEVMGAPNLWRPKAGYRLVWVSLAEPNKPVKKLLDLQACALVLGENSNLSFVAVAAFGSPEGKELPPANATVMRGGFDAAVALGVPREFALEWRFGA